MKNPPSFQYYPAHWAADTRHLDPDEDGAYHRLVDHCWINDGLPNDDETLRKITGVRPRRWAKIRHTVLKFFVTRDSTSLHHKRLLEERDKQRNYHQQKVDAGKRSAEARQRLLNERSTNAQRSSPSSSSTSVGSSQEDIDINIHRDSTTSGLVEKTHTDAEQNRLAFDRRRYVLEVIEKMVPRRRCPKCRGGKTTILDGTIHACGRCNGAGSIPTGTTRNEATLKTLYTVCRNVPFPDLEGCLAAMQDKRLSGELRNPIAYFLAIVQKHCQEHHLNPGIDWKPKGDSHAEELRDMQEAS